MTGSRYSTEDNLSMAKVMMMVRYPDAGSDPETTTIQFVCQEYGASLGMDARSMKDLLKQCKDDDPRLYDFITGVE